jgi:hypothetical protein
MDVILQAQFQRVEIALNTLIDSITSYNPSTQAAVNLVTADDELSKGLEQCTFAFHAHCMCLTIFFSSSSPSQPCPHP